MALPFRERFSCTWVAHLALVAFIFICVQPAQGNVLDRRSKASFLSASGGKKSRQATGWESSLVTFSVPVTPPPLPPQTALQPVDGAVTDEINEAGDAAPKKPPVLLTQIILLWQFVIYVCVSVASGVVALVLYNQLAHHVLIEQQAMKLQFLLIFALLILCPACRASAASQYSRVYWILAIRNIMEMYLMLIIFCTLPYMILEYMKRCCNAGAQEAAMTAKTSFAEPRFKLRSEWSAKWLGCQNMRDFVGLPQTNGAADTSACIFTSPDWNWQSEMDAVRRVFKPMAILLAARPVIQVVRSVGRIGFGVVEAWQVAATCTGLSFILLAAAASVGIYRVTPIVSSISSRLGVPLITRPLQMILAAVVLAGQAQDFFFLVYYGSENLAQVLAGLLFAVEIAMALLLVGALLSSDPLVEMVRFRVGHASVSLLDYCKLLLYPYVLTFGRGLDESVTLKRRPLPNPKKPMYMQDRPETLFTYTYQEHEQEHFFLRLEEEKTSVLFEGLLQDESEWARTMYVEAADRSTIDAPFDQIPEYKFPLTVKLAPLQKRNIWRGVLTDIFADKVRSKSLTVLVLSVTVSEALFQYPEFISAATWLNTEFFPVYGKYVGPGVQFLFGLLFCWISWLFVGVILLGNNIYFDKRWLWLVVAHTLLMGSTHLHACTTMTDPSPDRNEMMYYWTRLFSALISFAAMFESLKVLLSDENVAYYYRNERDARQYTSLMLERVRPEDAKKHADYAKSLKKPASNHPTLLLVGTVAVIPVVLAFSFVLLYFGMDVIRYARIGQVYYNALSTPTDLETAMLGFQVLDRNFNHKISPEEAGLATVLRLLGPSGESLIVPMNTLWASVSANGLGSLGVTTFVAARHRRGWRSYEEKAEVEEKDVLAEGERIVAEGPSRSLVQAELQSFLNIMYRTMALFKSIIQGDIAAASQSLVAALDSNKDGLLDQRELPLAEVALALQAVAPHFAHLVAPMLGEAWRTADTDEDDKLSIQELPSFVLEIKKRVMHLERAVQDLVLSLVLTGVSGFGMDTGPAMGPAPTPAFAPAPSVAMIESFEDEVQDDVDDVSMLQRRKNHHHKVPRSSHWKHHHSWTVHLEQRKHTEQSAITVIKPEPKPSAPAPSYAVEVAPAASAEASPNPAPDPQVLDGVSFMIKILMENTASLGEAFSLLLVAFDAILPGLTATAEKLLTSIDGRSLSAQLMQVADERWVHQSARVGSMPAWLNPAPSPSSEGWAQEDVVKMEEALFQLMETAMPWLQAEGVRAKVLLDAVAEGAGSSSDDSEAVAKAFSALDTDSKDGKLNSQELGLNCLLALVNPSLASHAQELLSMIMGEDGLDKDKFGTMMQWLVQILGSYISDINGDGESNSQDVRLLAKSTSEKLNALKEAVPAPSPSPSRASLLQKWRPAVLRKVVHPETDLIQAGGEEVSKSATKPGPSSQTAAQWESIVKRLVQIFVSVNIDRIENALYISALASFAFGVFVVMMPFVGAKQLYQKMQEGGKYKGRAEIGEIKGRLDYTTAYPGMLFSTVLIGVVIVFFTIFTVLTILAIPKIYVPLIHGFKIAIIWTVIILLLGQILKRLVMDKYCITDGEVTHPRLFSCIYVMLIVMNFALGSLFALTRIAVMMPFLFVKFHILSKTLIDGDNVSFDGGYTSFLAMVKHHHDVTNPIRRTFLQAIAPKGERLYGEKPSEEGGLQSKAQRTRNRFWVGYILSQAPQLQSLRKRALAAEAKVEEVVKSGTITPGGTTTYNVKSSTPFTPIHLTPARMVDGRPITMARAPVDGSHPILPQGRS